MAAPPPPPPPSLMEELVDEILCRLPPEEPASLVRTALVCKPWCRLVSSPYFRSRFLEFHRTPPMLGFICNSKFSRSSFVRPTASPLHGNTTRWWNWCVLDVRHGRVLLRNNLAATRFSEVVVWDPIMNKHWVLPKLPRPSIKHPRPSICCTAAVLCATATGACDHRGCHRGPFRVVYVGIEPEDMFICTYSSVLGAWRPVSIQLIEACLSTYGRYSPSVLLGNTLYFRIPLTHTVFKYDLELHEKSWFQLPTLQHGSYSSVLMTTDDGRLGLVGLLDGILCIWVRMDTPEANAGWTQFKAIDLGKQELDVHPQLFPRASVVGFADALGIVFMTVNSTLYTVDLETCMVKKQVYNGGEIETIFPYIHFYTPALEAASFGVEEEPSASGSSA